MSVRKAIKNVLAHHYASKGQKHEEALNLKGLPDASFSPLTREEKEIIQNVCGGGSKMKELLYNSYLEHYGSVIGLGA